MCPVRSFFIYKEHLNPKSDTFFQRPKDRPTNNVWYDVSPLGHNSLGKNGARYLLKSWNSTKNYTNHSFRATAVYILDDAEFAGRHIMSITGHKSESSLKTYTGYTSDRALRDMSNTISSNLRETSTTENKENDLKSEIPDFDDNITDFLLMSDSQMESLVTMATDINNTSSTTCSNGDVNNNIAHVNNVAHVNNSVAHANNSVAHVNNNVAHVNNSVAHVNNSVAHANNNVAHVSNSVAHVNNSVAHVNNSVAHVNNSVAPVHSSVAHVHNSVAHVNHSVAHANNNVAHVNNNVAHVNNSVAHVNNSVAHVHSSVAPVHNSVAHVNNSVSLHQDSGHGFGMGVPNFNFSMQSNCLQFYSHPAAPLIANNYGTININISHN
jgi:archaellum component FlaC